jgi:hypothetical protein
MLGRWANWFDPMRPEEVNQTLVLPRINANFLKNGKIEFHSRHTFFDVFEQLPPEGSADFAHEPTRNHDQLPDANSSDVRIAETEWDGGFLKPANEQRDSFVSAQNLENAWRGNRTPAPNNVDVKREAGGGVGLYTFPIASQSVGRFERENGFDRIIVHERERSRFRL